METHSHAANVQYSRTLEASWRDTDHGLVFGCTFQLPAAGGEVSAASPVMMTAGKLPLTTLLSTPLATAKPQQAAPMRQRPSTTHNMSCSLPSATSAAASSHASTWRTAGVPRTALRERVASTRILPDNLRMECLERLERIDKEIPLKLRHRPSWTHLQDDPLDAGESKATITSSEVLQVDEECNDLLSGELEKVTATEPPSHITSAIPALQLPVGAGTTAAGPVGQTGVIRQGKQRRKRQVWAVENYDLTAAASVWKTKPKTTIQKGLTVSGRASDRALQNGQASQQLLTTQSAPVLRSTETQSPPPLGTDRTRRAIEEVRARMAEMADSKSTADGISDGQMDSVDSSAPAVRGVKSLLRTTLRYALQF